MSKDDFNSGPPDKPIRKRSFWDTLNPGYITAGLSSLALSWLSINNFFHKNIFDSEEDYHEARGTREKNTESPRISTDPEVEALHQGGETPFTELRDKRHFEMIEIRARNHASFKDYLSEHRAINKTYKEGMDSEICKNLHISKNVFKATYQKFLLLETHQQAQVGLGVLTVASIALGAIYSFARERNLAVKLSNQIADNKSASVQR